MAWRINLNISYVSLSKNAISTPSLEAQELAGKQDCKVWEGPGQLWVEQDPGVPRLQGENVGTVYADLLRRSFSGRGTASAKALQ